MLQSPDEQRPQAWVERSTFNPDLQDYRYDIKKEAPELFRVAGLLLNHVRANWPAKTLKTMNADQRVLTMLLVKSPQPASVVDCAEMATVKTKCVSNWARNTLCRLQKTGLVSRENDISNLSLWWIDLSGIEDQALRIEVTRAMQGVSAGI